MLYCHGYSYRGLSLERSLIAESQNCCTRCSVRVFLSRLSLHVYSRGPPLLSDEGRKRIRALSLIESDTISENNRCLLECLTKKAPAYLGDFVKSPLSCPKRSSCGGKKGRPGKNLGSNYLLILRSYRCARPLNRFSRLARLIISGFNAPF